METAFSYLVMARQCEIAELNQLARTCELVDAVCVFVHQLQQERGISNLYLGVSDRRFSQIWEQQLTQTDQAHTQVVQGLSSFTPASYQLGDCRLYARIACALHVLENLNDLRRQVRTHQCSTETATAYFNQVIGRLLSLIFEAADSAVDPLISRQLVALFNLMQGKEFVGQERALGAAAFAAEKMSHNLAQTLTYLMDLQEQCFICFESFADEATLAIWQKLQNTPQMVSIERLRRKLLTINGKISAQYCEEWFNACSERMDELHQAEHHLAGLLGQTCHTQVAQREQELEDHQALLRALTTAPPLAPLSVFAPEVRDDLEHGTHSGQTLGLRLTRSIVDAFQIQSRRLQAISTELATVRASLDERKIIERAKGLLMAHQSLSEEQAYRFLRQKAMNQNRRLVDVAQTVLAMVELLPPVKNK